MQTLRQLVPSAGSLIVFESAGRHLSFTAAARELGMSQAAVSYAVRALEGHLGVALFQRRHRAVALTEAGARFHADVALGLGHIRRSAADMRSFAGGGHVTLAASTAFASFWMLPRLQRFRDDLPGIELRIQTGARDLDIAAEGIPLAIRGGEPATWPGYAAARLADEEIWAVAGPSYVARHGAPQVPAALIPHQLIHLEEPYREAATWPDWFHSAGIAPGALPRGLRVNDYALVIQAVMEGQGIALGWKHLVERLVAAGLLMRLTGHAMRTGSAFHVVWAADRPLPPAAARARDWLLANG
jgi:DNA-binding transcriptional LysR family regulator